MTIQYEIERRFLVNFPSSWLDLAQMFDNLIDIKRITQTYLLSKKNEPSARVRKTIEGLSKNKKTVYHFNKKEFVEKGVNKETEFEIDKNKYQTYLKNAKE